MNVDLNKLDDFDELPKKEKIKKKVKIWNPELDTGKKKQKKKKGNDLDVLF
jgi:hypothetical protein